MKTAVLILAHRQPAHVGRLVAALRCDWMHFFIHVDAKTTNFQDFVRSMPADANTVFLTGNDRIKVHWAGFNTIKAILVLLRAALRSGERFDRFCLLSGADFPVKSLSRIREAFSTDREFIRVDRRLAETDSNSHTRTVRHYYFVDNKGWPWSRLSGKIRRQAFDRIPLYHGSTWWSLTYGSVKFVTEFIDANRDYVRFHRWTFCPEEIFFHSIIKHSPFASKIAQDFELAPSLPKFFANNEHGCHYIDWNAKDVSLPKVLTEHDYPAISASTALFARKFDEYASAALISLFERHDLALHKQG